MELRVKPSSEAESASFWNGLSAMERLDFVLNHQGHFLNSRLVKPGELLAVRTAPEFARKYIVSRENSPFFLSLDIKKKAESQSAFMQLATTIAIALSL